MRRTWDAIVDHDDDHYLGRPSVRTRLVRDIGKAPTTVGGRDKRLAEGLAVRDSQGSRRSTRQDSPGCGAVIVEALQTLGLSDGRYAATIPSVWICTHPIERAIPGCTAGIADPDSE